MKSDKVAAEYLEIAEIILRKWVKAGNIIYESIGRNIVFAPDELKAFEIKRVSI